MTWALIPFMALLNRFRGGGYGAEVLPGHPRFYVAPLVALLVGLFFGWVNGVIVGGCYLAWSLVPWGHFIGLGRWDPPRSYGHFERHVSWAAADNPWFGLIIVEFVGMIPFILILSPIAAIAPVLFVACYEAGWRLRPKAPIELAELLAGGVWGVLILLALSGCAPDTSNYYSQLSKGVGQQLDKSKR